MACQCRECGNFVQESNIKDHFINIEKPKLACIYFLPPIHLENKVEIQAIDIEKFYTTSSKNQNDEWNKKREYIVYSIINVLVPVNYYKFPKWREIKRGIDKFIEKLCKKNNIHHIKSIKCRLKGGRKNHNDFIIIINDTIEFLIEFKFSTKSANGCPQICSIPKPSRYLNIDFAEWFYDNYLPLIAVKGNLELPNKQVYLNTINNDKVECMKKYKEKYDDSRKKKKR